MTLTWKKIDPNNLPLKQLAIAKNEDEEVIIGFLEELDGVVYCESDASALLNCTHYILKSELLKLEVEG